MSTESKRAVAIVLQARLSVAPISIGAAERRGLAGCGLCRKRSALRNGKGLACETINSQLYTPAPAVRADGKQKGDGGYVISVLKLFIETAA